MYITNVTDEITLCNCTNNDNDNNIQIVRPLISKIPCGLSLICLVSLVVHTLVKPLINKKTIL